MNKFLIIGVNFLYFDVLANLRFISTHLRSYIPSSGPLNTSIMEATKISWNLETFCRLIEAQSEKINPKSTLVRFAKKKDNVLEVAILPTISTNKSLALLDRGLIGQFMGLWPQLRIVESWVQQN